MKPYKKSKFTKRDYDRVESKSFGRTNDRSSERSNDNSSRFERRDSGRSEGRGLELHEVTCDKCGRKCDVPFKPTGNKPVYCRTCFRKNDFSGDASEDFSSRNNDRREPSSQSSEELSKINRKLDKIMKALKIE